MLRQTNQKTQTSSAPFEWLGYVEAWVESQLFPDSQEQDNIYLLVVTFFMPVTQLQSSEWLGEANLL